MRHTSIVVRILAAIALSSCFEANAFCLGTAPDTSSVREWYDAASDRYYLAWATSLHPLQCNFDVSYIPPPAGTVPTGLLWITKSYVGNGSHDVCVFRADGQQQPASSFLTINPGECAGLKAAGSGWTYLPPSDTFPRMSAFEVDPATGRCLGPHTPVYRFVNSGWPDRGNHRYVADEAVRAQMRSRTGWQEEGIAFCVDDKQRMALSVVEVPQLGLGPMPPAPPGSPCQGGYNMSVSGCLHTANMGPFDAFGALVTGSQVLPFAAYTGLTTTASVISGYSPPPGGPARSFMQSNDGRGAGFHVSSVDRTSGNTSSIRTITRSMGITNADALTTTIRQPFLDAYDADMDLVLQYKLFVKRVRAAAGTGNEAYVQPVVTFIDQRSGRRLLLSPGAIGTPVEGDLATRDAATGDVLVYIALGANGASIGRSSGLPSLVVPKSFDATLSWGYGGEFAWRVNRREFPAVIARARTVDPVLSPDPQDYILEGIGIKGEVVGDASIGYNLQQMSASIMRP